MRVMIGKYTYEINAWLRTLDYLQQENIYMKTRLAETMKDQVNSATLEKAEYYQSAFINKDTVIAFLRQDILQFQENNIPEAEARERKNVLQADMQKMEKEFAKLKFEFNDFIQKGNAA